MVSGISVNGFAWPAIVAGPASAEASGGAIGQAAPQYGRGNHMDWGDGSWIVMIIMMSVFWLGALALGAWAIHAFSRRGLRANGPESPLDIARRRYASGELTQDQFEAIKHGLE